MAEVTNELMYDVLKPLQSDMAAVKEAQRERNAALNAIRIHLLALQQDIQNIQNIYGILTRHDARLDRIERRLEIAEVG